MPATRFVAAPKNGDILSINRAHSLALVHVHQFDEPILEPRAQGRKHLPQQQFALLAEVAKSTREEQAEGAGSHLLVRPI